MKQCKTCKQTKSKTEFSKNRSNFDRLQINCKSCEKQRMKEYSRTLKGCIVKIHQNQKHSSKRRGHPNPPYSRKELHNYLVSNNVFMDLYNNWVASGYERDLAPSCDRIDESKGYTLDNIRLMAWKENNKRQYKSRLNGEKSTKQSKQIRQIKSNGETIDYASISYAARQLGRSDSVLGRAVKNKTIQKDGSYFVYI